MQSHSHRECLISFFSVHLNHCFHFHCIGHAVINSHMYVLSQFSQGIMHAPETLWYKGQPTFYYPLLKKSDYMGTSLNFQSGGGYSLVPVRPVVLDEREVHCFFPF